MLNRPHSAKLLKSLSPQAKIINISNSNSGNANNFTSSNKIKQINKNDQGDKNYVNVPISENDEFYEMLPDSLKKIKKLQEDHMKIFTKHCQKVSQKLKQHRESFKTQAQFQQDITNSIKSPVTNFENGQVQKKKVSDLIEQQKQRHEDRFNNQCKLRKLSCPSETRSTSSSMIHKEEKYLKKQQNVQGYENQQHWVMEKKGCDLILNQHSLIQFNKQADYKDNNEINLQKFNNINQFVKIQQIGKGKFSKVFLVMDKHSQNQYALKILNRQQIKQNDIGKYIKREIQIQRKLDHENINKLFNYFADDENIYLLMAYCEQGELYQIQQQKKNKRFSEKEASKLTKQILEGLNYLHKNQIMHRDLKPENILLSKDQVKIIDFTTAAYFPKDQERRRTFCGTIDYIAPEIIETYYKNGSGYDHRCDIWALGILVYEFCTGKTLFRQNKDQTDDIVMQEIETGDIKFSSCLSQKLKDFLSSCLKRTPFLRKTTNELLRHPWILQYQ